MLAQAATFADFIVAIHILSVVVGFGVVFAYPVLMASASRLNPTVLPWLLRTRTWVGRVLVNPALLVLLLAGIYLASDEHQWSAFYVAWGIAAVIVLGAIEGAFMIRRHTRLAEIAERDLAATSVPGGQRTSATWSQEYNDAFRQVALAGTVMMVIVIVTVFLMATRAGA